MKNIIFIITTILCITLNVNAQSVSYMIKGDIEAGSSRGKIEANISKLLTEVTIASDRSRALKLDGISMTTECRQSLNRLWNNFHFACTDDMNKTHCLRNVTGYEVRNIPISLDPIIDGYNGELTKELVVCCTKDGIITDVHMALSNNMYEQHVKNAIDVTDARRRMEIMKFIEDFGKYYDEKDINALDAVFSEDALIITGTVITRQKMERDMPTTKQEIIYNKKNKAEYISSLKNVFNNNEYLRVKFDDAKITRNGAKPNFYGVSLHQRWESSKYSDDGYVFLLWEFPENGDDTHPVIHVRTWQPERIGAKKIDQKDIFVLDDFTID